jgi:uncharacterized membrane protein (DUF2068 family)
MSLSLRPEQKQAPGRLHRGDQCGVILRVDRVLNKPGLIRGCIIGLNAGFDSYGALTTHSHPNRNRWLIAIGVLKLLKAVLFVSMGFGVIKLLHKDIADVLLRATTALRFDPENRVVNVLLEKSVLLNPHRLKEISFAMFLYAALDIIEGTGLVLEKVWAEYFTLILTGSFLPWEFYEIVRHVTVFKVVLTVLNLLVFLYLAIVVNDKVRARQQAPAAGTD